MAESLHNLAAASGMQAVRTFPSYQQVHTTDPVRSDEVRPYPLLREILILRATWFGDCTTLVTLDCTVIKSMKETRQNLSVLREPPFPVCIWSNINH